MQREKEIDDVQRSKDDPALRSADEVTGYHIHASDGCTPSEPMRQNWGFS
jgi:hypothetical protein